jgi:hypothetical protein
LATSTDGLVWTKSISNPVISGQPDPAGIIKVGSTYYLYANATGGNRNVDVYSSTDLIHWTKLSPPEGIFSGGRYCSSPFLYNGTYYLLVSAYYNSVYGGTIELYSSPSPTFKEVERTFLGCVITDSTHASVDTPSVITDTIQRNSFPGGFMVYYSKTETPTTGAATYPAYLIIESNPATAIGKAVKPTPTSVQLSSGTFNISSLYVSPSFEARYGLTIQGQGSNTIVKLINNLPVTVTNRGVVFVDYNSIIENLVLDGNNVNQSKIQTGLTIGVDGLGENITLQNWTGDNADVYGTLQDVTSSKTPVLYFNGKITSTSGGGSPVVIDPGRPKRLVTKKTMYKHKSVHHSMHKT